ncbi:hypothetical protein CVT24_009552 [Panaeolus cyanescens]|uniref:F-box domain-containing protein n=1 Tax=Panaeolus cyanescens TaxID=181874 RepID=A0A409YAE3_9AGAR|nr:hypothetical protein CVT24_009552 [Panaeolus cyanescens]
MQTDCEMEADRGLTDIENPCQAVLNNSDLLSEIFGQLPFSKGGLLHVALTCRTFSKPALEKLWRHLGNIISLFKVLSNFCFRMDGKTRTWYFDGPVIEEGVQRLLYYGSLVRSLGSLAYTGWGCFGDRVFLLIARALAGRPLLPNLQGLTLIFRSNGDDPAILHLIHSPQLQSFNFSAPRNFSRIDDITLFVQKHAKAPNMRKLTIDCLSTLPVVQTSTSFQNLVELSLSTGPSVPIPTSVIYHWSSLKSLREMSIEARAFEKTLDGPTSKPCFKLLQMLNLACPLDAAIIFLSTAAFPVLSKLSFEFMLPQSPTLQVYPWARMFEALQRSTSSRFQELHVELWEDSTSECTLRNKQFTASYPGVPFTDLEATLLHFKLSHFGIYMPLLQPLTSEDAVKIRDAWPKISTLVLVTKAVEPRLDLKALKHFSDESWKDLGDLELAVDAAHIPLPRKVRSTHKLHSLTLQLVNWEDSEFDDLCSLASYIDSLFPYVYCTSFTTSSGQILEDVAGMINALQMGRRRERRYNETATVEDDYEDDDLSD